MKKKYIIMLIAIFVIILFLIFQIFNVKQKILKKIYPQKYKEYIECYCEKYGVDSNLVYSVIKAESNFDCNVRSNKGAKGLMQLMEKTAVDVNKKIENPIEEKDIENKINEPEYNINLGTKYLSILIEKYKNIELALTAYNAGSGTVDTWIENGTLKSDGTNIEKIPYKETNNYVRKIIRAYKIYKEIYKED